MMLHRTLTGTALVLSLLLGLPTGAAEAARPATPEVRTDTPSGLPVPRFVSAKFGLVNGRSGPGADYPVRYVYKKRGLPLLITAETDRWRRVVDPDGAQVWVHARTLDGKRTVMVRGGPQFSAILRRDPNPTSPERAILAPGTIAELDVCREGWCKVQVEGMKGWVLARGLWGTSIAQAGT